LTGCGAVIHLPHVIYTATVATAAAAADVEIAVTTRGDRTASASGKRSFRLGLTLQRQNH